MLSVIRDLYYNMNLLSTIDNIHLSITIRSMYLFVSTFIFMIRSVMQWLRMIVAVHSICISEYWPAQHSPAQQLYLNTAIVAAISGAAVHSRPQIKQNESHLHITFIFIYSPARSSSTRHFVLSVPYLNNS